MSNIRIAELDFDQIKNNLKTFLKAQDEFSDYDFEGSNLSVLIDLLSYNTHYNAYFANMLINEMFLDSAVKRSSAVSLSKHLGYTPVSTRSAIANLDITVNSPNGLPAVLTMDRYTQFSTTVNGTSYIFSTNAAKTASRAGTAYLFEDVNVVEGTLQRFEFVVTDNTPEGKYEIPNTDVDTSTLRVTVQTSASDTSSSVYSLATDITGLDETSKVYFLEQNTLGKYQLHFGDGVIGKQLAIGNIVKIDYIVSSGSGANVSSTTPQTFTALSPIGGSTNITVTVNSKSTGGASAESISSIKFNAPKINAAKNRAVTATDYKSLITSNFTGAESIAVWGGEENDPPIFGKVIICLKPYEGFAISDATKQYIADTILSSKKMLSVTPEFVDPSYLYVNITADVKYNSEITTLSSEELKTTVLNAINNYFNTDLRKFERTYNNSKLISLILSSNPSVSSVLITLKLQKRLTPVLGTNNTYTSTNSIKFRSPIKPGTISSSYFYVNFNNTQTLAKMIDIPNDAPPSDNGQGIIRLINPLNNSTLVRNVGTINYGTGEVLISTLTPTSLPANVSDIRINAGVQESFYNLSIYKNEVLVQDDTSKALNIGFVQGVSVTVTPQI